MPFSEEFRQSITKQGYKWARNSNDLGEIEKVALQYYDTQILHNRATGTYSLYVFGKKIHRPMFGKFEVAGVLVKEGKVEVIPKEGGSFHFKDITTFEDEKIKHYAVAEETIAEELEERNILPEQWSDYGIGPEVVKRLEEKRKVKEPSLIEFGIEPMYVKGKKGEKIKTLFAFGEHSIDVRGVPTSELEESLRTGLYQGFELKPEDIEIIKEEIRRRKEEEQLVELKIVERKGEETACPECSVRVETKGRWWAHLKIHHPKIYESLKAEEKAEKRRKARERAKKIPEDAKFIGRALNIDVFTANSILNKILSQDGDWQVVDWEAIGEKDWKTRYDRDEYLRQIEERVSRYGIDLHPVEEETKREMAEMQEEFEAEQLENLLAEIYVQELDGERVEFLKTNKDTLIKMAQRGDTRAKIALGDYFREVPMEEYLRPEEMKGRTGRPKITKTDIEEARTIAKQLEEETLENIVRRKRFQGRPLLMEIVNIYNEELEMRRGVQPTEGIDRERRTAEVKAIIAPLLTSQLEEMVMTGMAFDLKLEPWAIEIIKEELKRREEAVMAVIHGEDYPDVIRLVAEAKTITQLDKIIGDIGGRRYRLTPADELELQTRAIEKRSVREEELKEVEKKKEKPPARPPTEAPPVPLYPEPFIEMDTCTACGVASPNIDFDTRSVLSQMLGIPIHLFDACQRCVIGVYGYGDILTYISNAVENPRKFDLSRSDLDWLRKVERTIKESPMAVMFAVGLKTASNLGAWLYKYYKGEVLSIGMSNVFVTHREEIISAFGKEVADELGAATIASAMLVRDFLARKPLKTPKTAMDAVVNQVFPKFMMDFVEYGFDYVLQNHNITLCAVLSRFGFRVEPTGEVEFGRPKCSISDEIKDNLITSVINLTPDYEVEEIETR